MKMLIGIVVGMLFAPGVVAQAGAVDFSPSPGAYAVDTTALTLTGPGTNIAGTVQGGIAVFSFGNVNIPPGVTITAHGSRPLELLASGALTLGGSIEGNGASATDFFAGPIAGGPGGGAGGANGAGPGEGPGGGGVGSAGENGGGGGGFGGVGARGGIHLSGTSGAGGPAYGDLNLLLQGGSGGGGGSISSGVGGGGGGGAIALVGSTVAIAPSALVRVDGGAGASGGFDASGGGSGGGILLRADALEVNGTLTALGGAGGAGGAGGDGGGGGGGRILYQYKTLVGGGATFVNGGSSGTRSTGGCCAHGGLSPDSAGAAGVVTRVPAPSVSSRPATGVSSAGATMNAAINPNSSATSYFFEFGIGSDYGSRIPGTATAVGSDSGDHPVSQVLSGLAPGTTFHYRVVAVNALGFTSTGADISFTTAGTTTAPTPVPVVKPVRCKKHHKRNKRGKCVKVKHHKKHHRPHGHK
jgi:hypothetical protein